MAVDEQLLADFVAQRLVQHADEILGNWIDSIRKQPTDPLVTALPERAIRSHLGPVLARLASYIRSPTNALNQEMLGHLHSYGQVRRDLGHGLRDTLYEFDTLAGQIQSTLRQDVLVHGREWPLDDVLTVFERLAAGLRGVAFAVCASYRDTEQVRARALAHGLSEFGRALAHELRSPLQVISMVVESLEGEAFEADASARAAQIDVMQTAVHRTVGLLDGIRLLVIAEQALGKCRMQKLGDTLAMVREEMSRIAQRNGVRVIFPEATAAVAVEGVVAQLVLFNLLSNGIKYADPGKHDRWVRLETRLVDVEDTPFVRFEVSDNGLGIPKDMQPQIFRPRFRAHPEVSEGSGLGLTMSQSLLTERGGTIELHSRGGRGSLFAFLLRAIDAQSPASAHGDAGPSESLWRGPESNDAEGGI